MRTLSPKKQEILHRENTVLEVARDLLLRRGYHGLTMARVAEAAGCSKATVYQHFPCKEEMIIALATESVEIQRGLVERAATFQGRPRERMMAVGVATQVFAELYSDDARIFQIVGGEAVLQKASEKSIWKLRSSGLRTVNVMLGIVRDAVARGDLKFRAGHRPEDFIYNFWLLGEGGKAASHTWLPPEEYGVDAPFESIIKTAHVFADGYGWRPLSTEWDYDATIDRVLHEVYPVEWRKIFGGHGKALGREPDRPSTGAAATKHQGRATGEEVVRETQ